MLIWLDASNAAIYGAAIEPGWPAAFISDFDHFPPHHPMQSKPTVKVYPGSGFSPPVSREAAPPLRD
jgi:hypothetical protein